MSGAGREPHVLLETSPALPLVSITVAARGGAALDPPGKEGRSRVMGRLVRRTGAGLTTEELDERIDALGGSLGVEVGHSTTTFHATVIERSLDAFAELFVGVLGRPSLSADEHARLQRETLAELVEARDHDRSVAERFFRKALFAAHPYGRSASGNPISVTALTVDDARQTYGSLLASRNLVFAFAGDIDETRAHDLAKRLAAAVPAGEPVEDTVPEPTLARGRRLVFVDKPERTQTQILIGCLGTHPRDPDHIALHVGSTIFGGTFTARLMREVRSKRGWSYGAYSNLPYDRHRRGFSLWTFPKASDAAPCIALELDLLEKWHAEGVTPRELKWAQRYLVRSHAFAIDTPSKRAGQALDEALYDLPAGYHADYVERIRSVTLEEVNASIRTRITPEDLVVTVLGTAGETEESVRKAVPRLGDATTVRFDAEE